MIFLKKIFLIAALVLLAGTALAAKTVTVKFNFPLESGISDISTQTPAPDDENAFTAFLQAANENAISLDISYFDFDGDGIKESAFVNSANGITPTGDFSKYWSFSVNNKSSMVGISQSFPNNGDTISLDYFEGNMPDAIEWLADHQQESGQIGPNFFQSAFAAMGLSLAGKNNVHLDSSIISKAENFILSNQGNDAGFVDELNTAVAIMALSSNGKQAIDFMKNGKTSIDFLALRQNSDGGFESGTSQSDTDTTAWATLAFIQSGKNLPQNSGQSPADFLLSAQHESGGFGYSTDDPSDSIDFSEEAIIALAAAGSENGVPMQKAAGYISSKQGNDGCITDGFRTALGSVALRSAGETEKAGKALDCLKTLQNGDGSFGRTTSNSNAIDTGLAIIALSKETFPLTISQTSGIDQNGVVGVNSIIKFVVQVKNNGKVLAENVNVSLQGIPLEWIFDSQHGSIGHFDKINPGETRTAEIFAKMMETGTLGITAKATTDNSALASNSNIIKVDVQDAQLALSLTFVPQ
ncbi:MAG: prenyltransferase/squalene oxidase repeat-containing protein [archaeon]